MTASPPNSHAAPRAENTTEPCSASPTPGWGALAAWPAGLPLAAATVGRMDGPDGQPEPRWLVLAAPSRSRAIQTPADLALLDAPPAHGAPDPGGAGSDDCPFASGRLVVLGYGLGRALEPTAAAATPVRGGDGRGQAAADPLGWTLEVPGTLAFDRLTGRWAARGDVSGLPDVAALREASPAPGFSLGPLASEAGEHRYRAMVAAGLGLIAAGDVYQVNLAHRLGARFEGSARAFAAALFASALPLHGVYAEVPGAASVRAICSASPELFLAFDPATRSVRTSPMKGTRPIGGDAEELRLSEKDRAELNMITDLMRNDLGRVCAFGSVRVEHGRTIEAHGRSVWQATSTVSGRVRDGVPVSGLLGATFPPGSVTGAPKVRAMQIIDELELSDRGVYCGAMGWQDDGAAGGSGTLSLNVAIRTAVIETGGADGAASLTYHAGAGIVADSDPGAEWAETLSKAAILDRL